MDRSAAGALVDGTQSAEWSDTIIFGRRLRKFSLWHRFLLRASGSPYITREPLVMKDLAVAVAICQLKFPSSAVRVPKVWPMVLRLGLFVKAMRTKGSKNPVKDDLQKRSNRFLRYTADYTQQPEYAVISKDQGMSAPQVPRGKAPDEIEIVGTLIHWTGWDDEKIWNMRVGYANWLVSLAHRDKGVDIDFTTDAEREWREKLGDEYKHG